MRVKIVRAALAAPIAHQRTWNLTRAILFGAGDAVFLAGVGAVTTLLMHMMHEFTGSFLLACLVGMILAMLGQMLLAFAAAPLLGSIESMVPSMVLAMVSPMAVCAAHLLGCELGWAACALLGAALGVTMFVLLQAHGSVYRRSLCRGFPDRRAA